jgi:hypothetical protein
MLVSCESIESRQIVAQKKKPTPVRVGLQVLRKDVVGTVAIR